MDSLSESDDYDQEIELIFPYICPLILKQIIKNQTFQKFEGALLLIDISGFTMLSLQVEVETFQSLVNQYLSKIIQIINAYKGQIIKFAGDAIYVVWEDKKNLLLALECGLNVNRNCNNYEVDYQLPTIESEPQSPSSKSVKTSPTTRSSNGSQTTSPSFSISPRTLRRSLSRMTIEEDFSPTVGLRRSASLINKLDHHLRRERKDSFTRYLYVHSGMSVGLMGGLIVKHNGRTEYLLLGNPVMEVAMAEKQASKGELFLSPSVVNEIGLDNSRFKLYVGKYGCYKVEENIDMMNSDDNSLFKDDENSTNLYIIEMREMIKDIKNKKELFSSLKEYIHESERNCKISKNISLQLSIHPELRKVTVVFISIGEIYSSLIRSVENTIDDRDMDQSINNLQKAYEIVNKALTNMGGQLRQFIVDDKGTVAIGSFGLRGSHTENNAASAISASKTIIEELSSSLGATASIGITSGNSFCGLIGQPNIRCEYSIMGPSVNLSARLMCLTEIDTILCDEETKDSDNNVHSFLPEPISFQPKGYDRSVSTYRPLFNKRRISLIAKGKGNASDDILNNRINEINEVILFAYPHLNNQKKNFCYYLYKAFCPQSRLLAVSGCKGIGKTYFLKAVSAKFRNISLANFNNSQEKIDFKTFHSTLIENKSDSKISLNLNPYMIWKSIIQSMLQMCLGETKLQSKQLLHSTRLLDTLDQQSDKYAILRSFVCGDFLFPENLLDLVEDYLFRLFCEINNLSNHQTVLLFDDLNIYGDEYSLRLLDKILNGCDGVFIMATCTSERDIMFKEKDQCKIVVLNSLNKENIHFIAEDVLSSSYDDNKGGLQGEVFHNDVKNKEFLLNRVYKMCGGNPLYTIEFCKSLGVNLRNERKMKDDIEDIKVQIEHIILLTYPKGLEDAIVYRIDQLSHDYQKVLKYLSVIAINGRGPITFDILIHMLQSEYSAPNLIEIVIELQKRNFLLFKESIESHRITHDNLFDSNIQFCSQFERTLIYNVMLKAQKVELHNKIISYLENYNNTKDSHFYFILAIHCELCELHWKALNYYYLSAIKVIESNNVECHHNLMEGYMVFQKIKQIEKTKELPINKLDDFISYYLIPNDTIIAHTKMWDNNFEIVVNLIMRFAETVSDLLVDAAAEKTNNLLLETLYYTLESLPNIYKKEIERIVNNYINSKSEITQDNNNDNNKESKIQDITAHISSIVSLIINNNENNNHIDEVKDNIIILEISIINVLQFISKLNN